MMPGKSAGDLRWPVIFSSAIVVICFVLATALGEYRTRISGDPAVEIALSISPTIERLASVAVQLREIEAAVDTNLSSVAERRPEPSPDAVALWRDVGSAIQEYATSTDAHLSIGERQTFVTVHQELDRDMLQMFADLARDPIAARRRFDRLEATIDREERQLDHAIRAEARYASVEARRISAARRGRVILVVTLDAVSVVMAIVLTRLALRAALAQQRLQLDRSEELEMFAARVAHDILNPVAAAEISAVAALRRPDDLPHCQMSLLRVTRSLRRAHAIAEALFEFARSGARPKPGAVTRVREAVREAVEDVEDEAKASDIDIVTIGVADEVVACAAGALASILGNLLRNAIRYMGESRIRSVYVRAERRVGMVRVEVQDTGPGLPGDLGSSIFDPFVRGSNADGNGFGLGLATVRRLVEAHGGRVDAKNGPSAGCSIWFDLPRAPDAPVREQSSKNDQQKDSAAQQVGEPNHAITRSAVSEAT